MKKKGDGESSSQDGESYSDVSNDWSSNYNSHLWEQNDESQSTPKRKNYTQAEETTIV